MMKLIATVCLVGLMTGCCDECVSRKTAGMAVSPDGKNEIRLSIAPLSYEVLRDGVVVVAKTPIGMKINGACLANKKARSIVTKKLSGTVATPIYKKSSVDLSGTETFTDFGDWGIRLIARNDGVAYRFETKLPGVVTVNSETAPLTIPSASTPCWLNYTGGFGQEESRPLAFTAKEINTDLNAKANGWMGNKMVYLPFAYSINGTFVVVTESNVHDYPIWNFVSTPVVKDSVQLDSLFAAWPKKTGRQPDWDANAPDLEKGGRKIIIREFENYLVKTAGTRTFPWRTFVLADKPSDVCEADIVYALAEPQAKDFDFSWVKPGKVAWDWWNCFDNAPSTAKNGGCTTKTYERFIDFAAKTGVEYVIFDEGWSEKLNIWKYHPEVDVPHLINYANKKGVGIILWMAWAQVYGEEEKVAEYFAKLGAKGFKVDFMDRGDAEVTTFLEKFAAACAKNKMLVDYHGVYRPVGLHRKYPNVVNYEGIHGLEQLKWFAGGVEEEKVMMANDVRAFFLRLTAGPMDYTPGAMLNYAVGAGYKGSTRFPGSVGTRCRQMAMMVLYEAPLQMLCDSPTNYEKNMESFAFMAKTPVIWSDTIALGGCPDTLAAVARKANDGSWYAAAITDISARDFTVDTAFLGEGTWTAEIFKDGPDADKNGTSYIHETKTVTAGEKMAFKMAPGGGFVIRFSK